MTTYEPSGVWPTFTTLRPSFKVRSCGTCK